MAGTRTGFGSDIYRMGDPLEDHIVLDYDNISSRASRDSLSIQDKPKTESCIGKACKKLSTIGKNIKKKFTRKRKKSGLLPRMSDLDRELRFSDLSDYQGTPSFAEYDQLGGRRKRRRRRRTRKKKGGKRRRTRKKRKSRKRRKKRKTRRRR